MKIITPSYTILRPCALDAVARKDALHAIANAARTCYKSTGTDDATLVAQLVRNGHEAMLEHYGLTVRKQDGLQHKWEGRCWMNPPYGRKIGQWVQKAYESSLQGATVVCLLPARTDTAWWHDFCIAHAAKITFLRGRLKFGDAKHSAPFPSAVVLFEGGERG